MEATLTGVSSKGVSYYFFKCFVLILNVIITNFSLNAKERELGKTQENQLRTEEQSTLRKQSKLKLHKNNQKTREKDKYQHPS